MIEIFNVAVAVIIVIGIIWAFTDDDGIIGILAKLGIGGYYRYTYDFWHPDNPPKIIGPFDNRAEAEGILRCLGRHYIPLCIEVKYHLKHIEGAEPNIKIE